MGERVLQTALLRERTFQRERKRDGENFLHFDQLHCGNVCVMLLGVGNGAVNMSNGAFLLSAKGFLFACYR